ncbi:hypothetical protein COCSUDRAFT_55352 [Coccomyxa subellipsoidea C-169]|uniref:Uncharacterized protein n=1 Tax=Coccomyxa subellipsoidea (strain C-169) TaxID=574566 RepID=I0Z9M0_COCSC|nr:hypothetical protein COCSUDRAFT_55352 [Coccomyxa subellipsoidea C-169]EIE27339.1 hypothetical protein COCSUDRAFT_55352 [Coccomyxa subellipsoidea C-169]|eukprot:XP_005651883.1 hypothetical protein COCSUDRAFT_55352 [Coccomyxa subellipsoidea C-169]
MYLHLTWTMIDAGPQLAQLRGAARRTFSSGSQSSPPARGPGSTLVNAGSTKTVMGTVQQSVKGAGAAAYKLLPGSAKQLVQSASKPGAMQRVLSLQLEAFWQRHGNKVIGAGAVFALYMLWRSIFNLTSVFVNLSGAMAEFGFLALAAAVVAWVFLYFRYLYTIRPDAVYRKALVQLNTNPGILEVMGAPVAGSDLRAYVMTGGGLRIKHLKPRLRSRRLQMIFPLSGTERRGLVSLEAKKVKGRYVFKLLAVDVPSAAGPEQRIYLEGDERIYNRGSVMRELRDPFLNALSMRETYEAEDEVDEAAEEAAEAQAQRSRAAQVASGEILADDQGMYFHERTYWAVRRWVAWARERGAALRSTPVKELPAKNAADVKEIVVEKPAAGTS